MRDIEQKLIDGGINTIKINLSVAKEKGKITKEQIDTVLAIIKPTLDLKKADGNG